MSSSPGFFIPPLESPNPSPGQHAGRLPGRTPRGGFAPLGGEADNAWGRGWDYPPQGGGTPFIPSPAGRHAPQLPRSTSGRGPPSGTDPNRPVYEMSPGHWVYQDTGLSVDYIGYPSNPSSTRPSPNAPPAMNFAPNTPATRPGMLSQAGTPWSPNSGTLPPSTPGWGPAQPPAAQQAGGTPWGGGTHNMGLHYSPHPGMAATLHPPPAGYYTPAGGPMGPPPPPQHPQYPPFAQQPHYPPHPSQAHLPQAYQNMPPPPHMTPYTPYAPFGGLPSAPPWGGPPGPPPQTYTPGYGGYQPNPAGYPPAPAPADPWSAPGAAGWGQSAAPPPPAPGRPTQCEGDNTIPKFAAGPHYGPAMEPFDLHILGAMLELNPLLLPPPDTADDFLKWNMLFPPSSCHRSTDPSHVSWSRGRNEPATFPRITKLNLIALMFTYEVNATDPTIGVTCGDVVEQTYAALMIRTSQKEYEALKSNVKKAVADSYRWNRSTDPAAPGGRLGEGMRRLDFLGRNTVFGGLRECTRSLTGERRSLATAATTEMPWLFELANTAQLPQTRHELEQQQRREQEAENARERAAILERETRSETSSRSERRRSRHAPTIETVSDEDLGPRAPRPE